MDSPVSEYKLKASQKAKAVAFASAAKEYDGPAFSPGKFKPVFEAEFHEPVFSKTCVNLGVYDSGVSGIINGLKEQAAWAQASASFGGDEKLTRLLQANAYACLAARMFKLGYNGTDVPSPLSGFMGMAAFARLARAYGDMRVGEVDLRLANLIGTGKKALHYANAFLTDQPKVPHRGWVLPAYDGDLEPFIHIFSALQRNVGLEASFSAFSSAMRPFGGGMDAIGVTRDSELGVALHGSGFHISTADEFTSWARRGHEEYLGSLSEFTELSFDPPHGPGKDDASVYQLCSTWDREWSARAPAFQATFFTVKPPGPMNGSQAQLAYRKTSSVVVAPPHFDPARDFDVVITNFLPSVSFDAAAVGGLVKHKARFKQGDLTRVLRAQFVTNRNPNPRGAKGSA
jgi:hypothetical protein